MKKKLIVVVEKVPIVWHTVYNLSRHSFIKHLLVTKVQFVKLVI